MPTMPRAPVAARSFCFQKAARIAAATKGIKVMMGSGVDGSTFPHGTRAEFESLVSVPPESGKGDPGWNRDYRRRWDGRIRSINRQANTPTSSPFQEIRCRHHRTPASSS